MNDKPQSSLKDRVSHFFLGDFRTVGWAYFFILLVATLLQYFLHYEVGEGIARLRYNNYLIFKQSFFHLIEAKDLYVLYPSEHWDLFKYSPTFALFMAPMAILPDSLGLILWNALNSALLFYAIKSLPFPQTKIKIMVLWFILQTLLTSMQNSQSNGLMAALLLLSFNGFEKRNFMLASLWIVLGTYIKIFSLVGTALFLLYPRKLVFIGYFIMWFLLLLLAPLLVNSPQQLISQYGSWITMLSNDHSISDGLSVMAWLKSWFGIIWEKSLIVFGGVVLFCLPFARIKLYGDFGFRLLFLASILIWMVIFNHRAESATFVIAMCGVGIWYFTQQKSNLNLALVILAFAFTSLSATDIVPSYVRYYWIKPFILKAVFCIFIWFKIIYELLTGRYHPVVTLNQN